MRSRRGQGNLRACFRYHAAKSRTHILPSVLRTYRVLRAPDAICQFARRSSTASSRITALRGREARRLWNPRRRRLHGAQSHIEVQSSLLQCHACICISVSCREQISVKRDVAYPLGGCDLPRRKIVQYLSNYLRGQHRERRASRVCQSGLALAFTASRSQTRLGLVVDRDLREFFRPSDAPRVSHIFYPASSCR